MGGKGSGRKPKAAASAGKEAVTPQSQAGDDILGQEMEFNAEMPPLFEEEYPTEEQLTGAEEEEAAAEETPGQEEEAAEPEPEGEDLTTETGEEEQETQDAGEEEEAEEEEPKAEAAGEEQPGEEEPGTEEEEAGKPPKGYVPHAALYEERQRRKELGVQLENALRRIDDLEKKGKDTPVKIEAGTDEFADFKVLSDEEFDELAEEDPTEAAKYMRRHARYERAQEQKARAVQETERAQKQHQEAISATIQRVSKSVPGIYDEDEKVANGLADFAIENGFEPEFLQLMTNPSTEIIVPGSPHPIPLADGAACLIELLHKVREATAKPSDDVAALEAKIETRLRKEITDEVLSKFKGKKPSETRRSISQIPGGEQPPKKLPEDMTEADLARLSPDEQKQWLGG